MISRRSHFLVLWFVLTDACVAVITWLAAYWLRFDSGWFDIAGEIPDFAKCLESTPIVVLLALVAYRTTGQ